MASRGQVGARGLCMKRIFIGSLIAIAILLAAFIATPFLMSSGTVRDGISYRIEQLTGHEVEFTGDPSLSFSPFLGFEVSDLKLIDSTMPKEASPILTVEKVKAQLDLLPALLGNVEITNYQFLRPKMELRTFRNGTKTWTFKNSLLQEILVSTNENRSIQAENSQINRDIKNLNFGNLEIIDGIFTFEDEIAGTNETITSLNGMIIWPQSQDEMSIKGNGIWRGEGITTNATIEAPIEIMSGGESRIEAQLNSQPLTFTFNGNANMLADLFVQGEFEANTPSINRLASILKFDIGRISSSETWSVNGLLEATANNTNISEASFSIGENTATGVIRLSTDEIGKSRLDGTLAFENIDLVNYFNSLGLAESPIGDRPLKNNLEVDLRISSQTLNIAKVEMERVAAAVIIDSEGWTFDIGDASALEGKLIAKIGTRLSSDKQQSFLELKATDIDSESLTELVGEQLVSISGKSNFTVNVRTNQLQEGWINQGLNGTLEAEFKGGNLNGIDLNSLFPADETIDKSNIKAFSEDATTAFDTLNMKVFLNNGIASLSQTALQTGELKLQLIGDINLNKAIMDLQLQEVTEEGPKPERFLIKGSVASPSISLREGLTQ
jgi:AsmA protein